MSTETEKTNESLLISLMSSLTGETATAGEENTLNFRYTTIKDGNVIDESHTIDGEYFKIISKNQVTIDTEGADDGERSECTKHTLVDGVCIKCLANSVAEQDERIAILENYHIADETFQIDNSRYEIDIELPNKIIKYIYFKPTNNSLNEYSFNFNNSSEYERVINEIKFIIDGSELTAEKTIKFNIGTNKWAIELDLAEHTNYVYNLMWVGPMNNFMLEKVTHRSAN